MPRFENQRVLVTGSGRGIGSAIAHRFTEEGGRIQLVACSMDELETRSKLTPFASEVRAMAPDLVLPGSARHRHTYRSWLDETGAPMKVQQELMRHASISTTMNVYGAAMTESKREANSKVVRLALGA